MMIILFAITKRTRGDLQFSKKLTKRIPKEVNDFYADPVYLLRNICNMVIILKKIPYIKPKKNTVRNSKCSVSWKKMITLFQNNQDEFDKYYHIRGHLLNQPLPYSKEFLKIIYRQKISWFNEKS